MLYVADAMTGQDAVRSADEFHRRIGITGIVLTKLDGDSRGGAALSAAAVTGRPVKFAGTGEKVDELEPFDPARMVSRILGMGDVLGLIEKAEETVEREQAEELVRKLRRAEFTLEDYRDQMKQLRKMGPLDQVLSMIPGIGLAQGSGRGPRGAGAAADDRHHRLHDAAGAPGPVGASTAAAASASRRAAARAVEDVNRLLKQFVQARKLMKGLGSRVEGHEAARRPHAAVPLNAKEEKNAVDQIETDGIHEAALLPRGGGGLARLARRAVRRGARALRPAPQPRGVKIDAEQAKSWIGEGRQASDTVRSLLKRGAAKA